MSIREYFTALLLVCAVTAVASALAAEGKTKKYVNFVLSLVVMLVLLSPLASLAGTWDPENLLPQAAEPTPSGGEVLLEVAERELKTALCDTLGLKSEEVLVGIEGTVAEDGTVTLRGVNVTLRGDSRTARERVREYLVTQIKADCEVRVNVE